MEKVLLAMSKENDFDLEKMKELTVFCLDHGVEPMDIMIYPSIFPILLQDGFVEIVRRNDADTVLFADIDGILADIYSKGAFSKVLNDIGVKAIDIHTGQELNLLSKEAPIDIQALVEDMINDVKQEIDSMEIEVDIVHNKMYENEMNNQEIKMC